MTYTDTKRTPILFMPKILIKLYGENLTILKQPLLSKKLPTYFVHMQIVDITFESI